MKGSNETNPDGPHGLPKEAEEKDGIGVVLHHQGCQGSNRRDA